MKRIFIYSLFLFLLAGCSNNKETSLNTTNSSTEKKEIGTDTQGLTTTSVSTEASITNPQVTDDTSLLASGDSFRDRKGEATLIAINDQPKSVQIDSIKLTVKNVKLIDYRPAYSLIDFYHTFTHEEQFAFVKFFVEIENSSKEKRKFSPIAFIQTNSNEMITWEKDIYLEELNGVLSPGERKKGNIGFIVKKSDLNKIELSTSDVYNGQEKLLGKAKTLDFMMK